MKTLDVLALVAAFGCAASFSPLAAAHASLKRSSPAAGATLAVAPKEVTLTFDEKVEQAFSAVSVKDAAGKDAATAKTRVDAADGTTLHLDVPTLASGTYSVQWVAVGHDGHRRTGDFKFTVK